jgi:hypothetical protein
MGTSPVPGANNNENNSYLQQENWHDYALAVKEFLPDLALELILKRRATRDR